MQKGWPLWLAGTIGVLAPSAVVAQNSVYGFHADVLGTQANIMRAAPTRDAAQMAAGAAWREIARLDLVLSNYRADSELRRLNAARQMRVSPDLFAVLSHAEDLHRRSGGAFNPRMGGVEALWRQAQSELPDAAALRRAVDAAQEAPHLDPHERLVRRPEGATFAIDALAKGYIVDAALDAALDAARRAAPLSGIMMEIGGDLRCQGRAGGQQHWQVGLADARLPFANAPLVAQVMLKDQAIATSGRGVRDRIVGGVAYGTTFCPWTGMPVTAHVAASVVAPTTAEADGLATALLVMPAEQGLLLAAQSGAQARLTQADGLVHRSEGWEMLEAGAPRRFDAPAGLIAAAEKGGPPLRPSGWVSDWALQVYYEASIDQNHRPSDYRSPYLVMWISDKAGRPIRTLLVVGKDPEYQKDNHIWWSLYGSRAQKIMDVRSGPTSLSGRYPSFWPGIDDSYESVGPGDYLLNIETSRERGEHTFRSVPVRIGQKAFAFDIRPTADMGAVRLAFGKQP